MARIFTSLLLLTVLILDGATAAPIPEKEAITLILEALLQEAYAEPHQAVQRFNANAQQLGNHEFKDDEQFVNEEEQDSGNNHWPKFDIKKYLQHLIEQQQQQQQKSDQARAQEQYDFVRAQNFGGAMGYERAKQYTGADENALAQLQYFLQQSHNQGVVHGRGDG